ncbi:MAG: hypothetical protein ACQEQU_02830 [Spirochaetota bacterium]
MVNMSITAGGLKLKNPLILASAGYTSSVGGFKGQIPFGYGAVISKTVTSTPLDGAPKPTVFWYDKDEKQLLSGVEGLKNPGIDKMVEIISEVKDLADEHDCKIIGSCTGNTTDEVIRLANQLHEAGAAAIELNIVCPNTGDHLGPEYSTIGKWWSYEVERTVKLIKEVKQNVPCPIWAKLPLEKLVDKAFLETIDNNVPPDAYSFVGGRLPNLKIDITTGKPILPGNLWVMIDKKVPISPMVTGTVKPSTILHTAYLSKMTKTDLVCAGDLQKGEDILEAIMAGASATQICKVVYRNKRSVSRILDEFEKLLGEQEYSDLHELKGKTLAYLPDPPLLTVPMAKWST